MSFQILLEFLRYWKLGSSARYVCVSVCAYVYTCYVYALNYLSNSCNFPAYERIKQFSKISLEVRKSNHGTQTRTVNVFIIQPVMSLGLHSPGMTYTSGRPHWTLTRLFSPTGLEKCLIFFLINVYVKCEPCKTGICRRDGLSVDRGHAVGASYVCGNIRGSSSVLWPTAWLSQCLQISHVPQSNEGIIQSTKFRIQRSKDSLKKYDSTLDTISGYNKL